MKKGAAFIVAGNLASKLVGMGREVVFAAWFGTGTIAAGYRIAQTAYLLPTQALIGDSLSAGLLPLYRDLRAKDEDLGRAIVIVASMVAGAFSVITALSLFVFARRIAEFIAPGANEEASQAAENLLRILSWATPFFVLSGMLSYIETAFGRFGAIAWRPMLLNIGALGGALIAYLTGEYRWLAGGIVISHFAFFVWTAIALRGLDRLRPIGELGAHVWQGLLNRLVKNMLPLIGLPFVAQCMMLVERMISSHLGTQVIPSVDYARFISDTMVQLIAVPLGVLTMATRGGEKSDDATSEISASAKLSLILAMPVALLCVTQPDTIVRLLFQRGAFNADSVYNTSHVLRWMGASLVFTVPGYYLVKALNSQLRNGAALLVTAAGVAASVSVNVFCWKLLGVQTIGIAYAAYSIVVAVSAAYLLGVQRSLVGLVLSLAPFIILFVIVMEVARLLVPSPWDILVSVPLSAAVWCIAALRVAEINSMLIAPAMARFPRLRFLERVRRAG